MESIALSAKTRDLKIKAKDVLKTKQIPAEYYGKGVKNQSLILDYSEFLKAFRKAGKNTIVKVEVDGKDKFDGLIYDVQYHPVTDQITHVDFINVRMDQEIHTKVPLEFVGTSIAVKDFSGTLTANLNQIDVKCLPRDLVHKIEVSIEPLVTFHMSIRVKDLVIPPGLKVLNGLEETVVTVTPPKAEEEEKPAEAVVAEGATAEGAVPAEGGAAPAKGAGGQPAGAEGSAEKAGGKSGGKQGGK
ncbi:MAG: 50S ribosomal protein L25 [Candidatus Gracilibacteria bacterium]|jgi:large subunit ribosomal protein L25